MTSSGLRWQIAAIFNVVQHPVLGCIDAPHPCGLRRSRPGRPAGGQQTSCCAHPRRRLVTIQAGHDPQKPGPAAIAAQLVEQFLDSETSMTG